MEKKHKNLLVNPYATVVLVIPELNYSEIGNKIPFAGNNIATASTYLCH